MNKVVIIGASGHGKVIADILELNGNYEILGFIDKNIQPNTKVLNYNVLGDRTVLFDILQSDPQIGGIIGIGDNWNRKKVAETLLGQFPKFNFVNALHPFAIISKYAKIGRGVVAVAGSIINSGAEIGDHCIINTKASVGHDVSMLDFSSIAPGVTLGGNVKLGELSAISMGSVVRKNVTIGNNTVVGSSSYVHNDLKSNILAYGIPAKIIRSRNHGDTYL